MSLKAGFEPILQHEETYKGVAFRIFTRARDGRTWGVFDALPPNHPYDWSRYFTDAEAKQWENTTPQTMRDAVDRCLNRTPAYRGDIRYRHDAVYRKEHP
jgi:hypothetical protein